MSWPAIVMWLVIACVGVPSAWRNSSALALLLSWLMGETAWLMTGDSLPLSVYFMADVAVIAIIYAKAIRHAGVKTYYDTRRQLAGLVSDLTVFDRWIVAIFLLGAWPLYLLDLDPRSKWFLLWGLTIAQFLLACAEAIQMLRLESRAQPEPCSGDGLAFAGRIGGYV